MVTQSAEKPATQTSYSPGLEGVIAGPTDICTVSSEKQTLTYRGYDIKDLIAHSDYEETAYLLLHGELPSAPALAEFKATLVKERTLPQIVTDFLAKVPQDSHPMEQLKAATALLALFDEDKANNSHDANIRKATRLIAKFPTIVAFGHRYRQSLELIQPAGEDLNIGENFLYMTTGEKPQPTVSKVFNATLQIYAEHGFNASTFSARVVTSTLSDMFSGIGAAVGALKGPLHGGANEQAMKMFQTVGSIENAEPWLREALANKTKVMGFGHRAYKQGDPRAGILKAMREDLIRELGDAPWPHIADIMEQIMLDEKGLHPNVDYPIAYMYFMMGLPTEIYTPIFAMGRVAGWASHVIEQLDNNRLIRPKALYEGHADRDFPIR